MLNWPEAGRRSLESRILSVSLTNHSAVCTLVNSWWLVHIIEYNNYEGYDKSTALIRESEVCILPRTLFCCLSYQVHFQHAKAYQEMLPFLTSRSSQLTQEFAFFPTSPPHAEGGIFELRSYQLKAGALLEWEHAWYVFKSWYMWMHS